MVVADGQTPTTPAVAHYVDGLDDYSDANLYPFPPAAAVRHGKEGGGEGAVDDEEHGGGIGTDEEAGAEGGQESDEAEVAGESEEGGNEEDDLAFDDADLIL